MLFFNKKKEPIKIWFDTDIHCHVVPGVDDGAQNTESSVKLISELADLGIRRIVATPHVTEATFENTAETLDGPYNSLVQGLADANVDVPVVYGSENRIDNLLMQNIENGTLLPMPGNHVLIENSFVQEPWDIESTVYELRIRNFKPIFAHPERFSYYHRNFDRLKTLHEQLPFQINLLSLSGYYGKDIKKMAEALIDNNMVDFVGTDTHGMRHIDSFREYLATPAARHHRDALADRIHNSELALF